MRESDLALIEQLINISSKRCGNLLQNPGFENGLGFWETQNVIPSNGNPFTGTQVASLRQGVASMFQDVMLPKLIPGPLFLSFNVAPATIENDNGCLTAEVLWLDGNRSRIAVGLSIFIPNGRTEPNTKLTFYDVTDTPPAGAVWARLQFSKGAGENTDIIEIDQVILIPAGSLNLVKNPGFESGLINWAANGFAPSFNVVLEGAAAALTSENGTLYQDVPIGPLNFRTSFLLGFNAHGFIDASLSVRVLWLNLADSIIQTGLDLTIPAGTLYVQGNYLSYLDITDPAPLGAVKARILFTATSIPLTTLYLDQVIFIKTVTPNLIENPSFEDGLAGWNNVNTTAFLTNEAYEGDFVARISDGGGLIFQDIPVSCAAGRCFLLNYALGYRRPDNTAFSGDMLAKVVWLDGFGRQIGLGLNLVVPGFAYVGRQWLVYAGITEPAPLNARIARIQFTKSLGSTGGTIDVDKVIFSLL